METNDQRKAPTEGKNAKLAGGDVAIGSELDILVLERVMHFRHTPRDGDDYWFSTGPLYFDWSRKEIPPFSTDLNAANMVLDLMSLTHEARMFRCSNHCCWRVQFSAQDGSSTYLDGEHHTLAEAICRAALNAVQVKPANTRTLPPAAGRQE